VKAALATTEDRLGAYLLLPVVASFVTGTVAYGTYLAPAAVRPEVATLLRAGQVTFGCTP